MRLARADAEAALKVNKETVRYMASTTLEVRGLFEELDHLGLEKQLRQAEGVRKAEANPAAESITVEIAHQLDLREEVGDRLWTRRSFSLC